MFMSYTVSKLTEIVDRFIESSDVVTEYVYAEADYVSPESAANSLRANISRNRQSKKIKVSVNNGKVYMTKKF